jgi:8-oxo-dGTP pyrophosphatase MutT (NUDIX family)
VPAARTAALRHLVPAEEVPAAVLIPLIDHATGLTVLFTERAAELRYHPGQISFPGGRVESIDASPLAAALRETEEEIGLGAEYIEVLGYLPDHLLLSGFRVTPVVGLVRPGFSLSLDPIEVAATFEVPLAFLFEPANHRARRRQVGAIEVDVFDVPFGERNIWGATAGMLMTFYDILTDDSPRRQ